MVGVLPSLLTLGNAVCGFGSLTIAARLGPDTVMPKDLYLASLLIFAAMIFDMLDGPVARLTKLTSSIGAQLDSLADAISFGVAPAFLMLRSTTTAGMHPLLHRLLWVIAVWYMLSAVLRLARFNVTQDGDQTHDYFTGLPSPAAAGTVASLVIIVPGLARWSDSDTSETFRHVGEILSDVTGWLLPLVTFAVACLMVSRVRYPHVFNQFIHGRQSYRHLVKLIFALIVIFAVPEFVGLPLVLLCFVAGAPLRAMWFRAVQPPAAPAPPAVAPPPSAAEESPAAELGDRTQEG
jgi:CDP-diacylglycerol--serine O-phosphatidyltransferase